MEHIKNPFTEAIERVYMRALVMIDGERPDGTAWPDHMAYIKTLEDLRAKCPVDLTVFVGNVPVVVHGFGRISSTDGALTIVDLDGKPKARFAKWDEVRRGDHSERVSE